MMRVFLLTAVIAFSSPLRAQTSSPPASPSLEQRVADLEAYVNNSARGADSANAQNTGPSYVNVEYRSITSSRSVAEIV